MNICVAGWYFHSPFIQDLLKTKYPYFVVSHREIITEPGIPIATIPNVGLEFNCYNWYLQNKWTGGPVLFLHDDSEVTQASLAAIAALDVDQAFLFHSEADAQANGLAHGRAIFCSDKFLTRLKVDGGFWYSEEPCDGKPIPPTTAEAPDFHNTGIQVFRAYLETLPQDEFAVNRVAIVPGLKTGYRGRI